MKWTSIKVHLLPLIMQEIEVCEKNYIELINKIKSKRTKELIDEFIQMRSDISKRIEELENYFDENFGNIRMNILQKGIFQLKKLLFYNPDKNNEQDEPDLKQFTGLVLDLDLIKKNTMANQEFSKNLRKKNLGGGAKNKMMMKMNAKGNKQMMNKNMGGNAKSSKFIPKVKDKIDNQETNEEEQDEFKGKTAKKKIRIRLTDEEYRLLLKLKEKKNTQS